MSIAATIPEHAKRKGRVPNQNPKKRKKNRVGQAAERIGKVQVSAWIDPARRERLRILGRRENRTIEQLIDEGLEIIFATYEEDGR